LRITGDLIVSGNNNSFTDVIYFGTLQNTGANNVFSWTDYSKMVPVLAHGRGGAER